MPAGSEMRLQVEKALDLERARRRIEEPQGGNRLPASGSRHEMVGALVDLVGGAGTAQVEPEFLYIHTAANAQRLLRATPDDPLTGIFHVLMVRAPLHCPRLLARHVTIQPVIERSDDRRPEYRWRARCAPPSEQRPTHRGAQCCTLDAPGEIQ